MREIKHGPCANQRAQLREFSEFLRVLCSHFACRSRKNKTRWYSSVLVPLTSLPLPIPFVTLHPRARKNLISRIVLSSPVLHGTSGDRRYPRTGNLSLKICVSRGNMRYRRRCNKRNRRHRCNRFSCGFSPFHSSVSRDRRYIKMIKLFPYCVLYFEFKGLDQLQFKARNEVEFQEKYILAQQNVEYLQVKEIFV